MAKKYQVDDSKDIQELSQNPGVCPYCGSEMIDFHGPDIADDQIFYDCDCEDCGNSFKEWYLVEYDGTWGYPLKSKKKKMEVEVIEDPETGQRSVSIKKKGKKNG
jgi:transposase-like protein